MNYRQSHLSKGEDYDEHLNQGDFNSYMTDREYVILKRIVKKLFAGKVPRHLDFACGTGRVLSVFEPMTTKSFGIDVSETMVNVARNKCQESEFFIRDITKEKEPSIEPVNLVTAFRFFGNAEHELRKEVLTNLSDYLLADGYLVFNNHRNPWTLTSITRRLSGEEEPAELHYFKLKKMLHEAGFEITKVYGIGIWLMMHRFNRPPFINSTFVKMLEPLSLLPGLFTFCPDMIIVAQKKSA